MSQGHRGPDDEGYSRGALPKAGGIEGVDVSGARAGKIGFRCPRTGPDPRCQPSTTLPP